MFLPLDFLLFSLFSLLLWHRGLLYLFAVFGLVWLNVLGLVVDLGGRYSCIYCKGWFFIFTWSVGASVTLVWFWVGAGMVVVVVTLVGGLAVVGVSLRMSS